MDGIKHIDFTAHLNTVDPLNAEGVGFRLGDKGTHTSRTVMLAELSSLLQYAPGHVKRGVYEKAILEDNCLAKRTTATRKLTLQRLSELYGLDTSIPIFRALLNFWERDESSRPLLAILTALARDPLLSATAGTVLNTPIGEEVSKHRVSKNLAVEVGHRFNASILDKIVRNALSSWTQSGHLEGRVRKIRRCIEPTPVACAFALLLGYMLGKRGRLLFETPWVAVLDPFSNDLLSLAADAKRIGLLELKQSGTIIDVSFPQFQKKIPVGLRYGTY